MHEHHGSRPFPLFPLLGAGFLMLATLVSVAWIQWFGEPAAGHVAGSAAETGAGPAVRISRDLRFEDLEGGAVAVFDARGGQLIQRLEPGTHGFIRATLRGLVRARRARGVGGEVPFRLELIETGQLLLVDPVTGQAVDLWAFGATNARSFEALLSASEPDLAAALPPPAAESTSTYE